MVIISKRKERDGLLGVYTYWVSCHYVESILPQGSSLATPPTPTTDPYRCFESLAGLQEFLGPLPRKTTEMRVCDGGACMHDVKM